jgi:hypothetical protein
MYEELDNTTFVPLICVDQDLLGKYDINKLGQIRNKKTGKIITTNFESYVYPAVSFGYAINGHRITKNYYVHLLVAKTFIQNPDPINKTQVHHIDGNKNNFRINNLEWISPQEHSKITNSKNKGKSIDVSFLVFLKKDSNGSIKEELPASMFSKQERSMIYRSIRNNKIYKGFYWSVKNLEVENYYSKFTEEQRAQEVWAINNYHGSKITISNLGVFYSEVGVYPKLGHKTPKGYRRFNRKFRAFKDSTTSKNKNIGVHVLVAETFILGRKTNPGEIVDHKDGNKENNSIWNLSVGTQKDNMNNPLTREKLGKKICMYTTEGKFITDFQSTKIASEILSSTFKSLTRINIFGCLAEKQISAGGFLFAYQDGTQDEVIKRKLDLLAKRKNKNK